MPRTLFSTVRIAAAIMLVVAAVQSVRADDDTTQRRDEARLVLMEEHVEGIAAAAGEIARLSAVGRLTEAQIAQLAVDKHVAEFNGIVTDYFLGRRIKPTASGGEQAQAKTLRDVSLLHAMIVQTTQCKDGSAAEACKTLTSLIEKLRGSLSGESKPGESSKNTPKEKQDQPEKEVRDGRTNDASQDEVAFQISEAEKLLLRIVNAYRKKQGLKPLRLDEKLCLAAREHSSDMKKHSFFSHQSPVPGRLRFTDRAKNHGATANAENIARDCKDPNMAMKLWVNSQSHRANLTGTHSRMGIGIDKTGLYTQVFGK